jgi:hypothetical protein
MDSVTEQQCKIYSFDNNPALGQRLVNMKSERFVFKPFLISPKTNASRNEFSVEDIMKQFSHSFIDFFKIDIEGKCLLP